MAKQTPGAKCDTGSKYELSVTALFASFLSKNENVQDYRIFSNLAEAHPFDDIVAEVHFKGLEQRQIYAIQVKSGKDKFNINKYCDGYDRIIREGGLNLGENVRNERISFWYLCSKSTTKKTFPVTKNANTFDLKLKLRSRPYNLHEAIFDKAVSHELFCEDPDMTDHQNLFENFYLFFHQPDTDKIIYIIKGIWNIDKPWLILRYLDNYLAKSSNGLDKSTFEHEVLKIRLSDCIVAPIAAIALPHQAVDEWNRLILKQDVTIVQNETNIEPYLFGCILQNISHIISIKEWNHTVDDVGKLHRDLKSRLKAISFKANTLAELIFQAWIDGKIPLILRTSTSLRFLKEFSHLKKCYVIIDSNVDKKYNEIGSCYLSVFRHLGDVESNELIKCIPVSLQGRQPTSLYEIINEDEKLKEVITCLDVINFMKPRELYLKQQSLEGNDYMLCIVEARNGRRYNDNEAQTTGNNIAVYCEPNESESIYSKYRSEPRFGNYKILRLRLTDDDKLKLISRIRGQYEEEYRGLECFFVDENGESVYNMANGTIVPVIGEVSIYAGTHFCWKYVPRHLREGIIKEGHASSSKQDVSNKFSIKYSGKLLEEEDILRKTSGKITIVTGEAGIGKTTLLHTLFNRCETKYYVLFVDLGRIRADLLSGKLKSFQHLLNLARNKCRSLPYNTLLNSLLDCPTRLVLILDSFDEIVATCKEEVLEFIKNLQEIVLPNVIIGSRLTAVDLLLDNFQTHTFKIEGFNEQCEHYLDNWNLDINNLRRIPSEFLTNPLYLNMLKTISENGVDLEVVNRCNLYEKILNLRVENYCRQKDYDKNEEKDILANHGELALKVVFGTNKLPEKLQKKKHGVPSKYSNFIRLGFIISYDNENPVFVHHTFAEFFVAKWLIMNSGDDDAAYIYRLMLDNQPNMSSVYETLPLHKAVINRNVEEVKRLIKNNTNYLLETDCFGKNPLHLATIVYQSCNKDIPEILIQCMRKEGYDIYVRDNIMKWTWIDYIEKFLREEFRYLPLTMKEAYFNYYATHIEKLEHCVYWVRNDFIDLYDDAVCSSSISLIRDLLFLKYHENEVFSEFREMCLRSYGIKVSRIDLRDEKLKGAHLACIYGNTEVVRAYIKSGAIFTKTDKFNCTPLHYSVMAKQRNEIVELLLDIYGIPNLFASRHNQTTILHMSVRTGDVNVTKMILERVNIQKIETVMEKIDNKQCTPLSLAIESNDMVELLLQHTANPNNTVGDCLLLVSAIETGNKNTVQTLLDYGADVNANVEGTRTPLCSAIDTSEVAMVQLLLQNGANVKYVDQNGRTPLTHAIHTKATKEIVQILLNNGADVNLMDKYETPLCRAIKTNTLEIIELLLRNEARLDCLNSRGWTPLIYAVIEGRQNIVNMLLGGINFKGKHGTTPLCEAINKASADIIQILLDHQADVNSVDEYGLSPLIIAAEAEGAQIAEMLLNKGADVNFENEYGITALYAAAFKGNVAMVELLLKHDADVNVILGEEILRNARNAKKIEIALRLFKNRKVGHLPSASSSLATNVIERVAENWARVNLKKEFRTAVNQQLVNLNTIEILKEWGGRIDIKDEFWKPIFCLVNEMNNEEVDNAFFRSHSKWELITLAHHASGLESDVNLDIITILSRHYKRYFKFLQIAAKLGNKEMIQITLANTDARHFVEALHIAVRQQNTDIVQMLLEHRCATDVRDDFGVTPLSIAVGKENMVLVELLLTKGADINAKVGFSGFTALHIAALKEDRSMVRRLLEYGANKNVKISKRQLRTDCETMDAFGVVNFIPVEDVVVSKIKGIIAEESTEIVLKRNVKVRKILLSKICYCL